MEPSITITTLVSSRLLGYHDVFTHLVDVARFIGIPILEFLTLKFAWWNHHHE